MTLNDNQDKVNRNGRFRVDEVFMLESRKLIVLVGEILDGVITPNMSLKIPFNSSFSMTVRIKGVEFILHSGGVEKPAITLEYNDEDERELLLGVGLKDEEFVVSN